MYVIYNSLVSCVGRHTRFTETHNSSIGLIYQHNTHSANNDELVYELRYLFIQRLMLVGIKVNRKIAIYFRLVGLVHGV